MVWPVLSRTLTIRQRCCLTDIMISLHDQIQSQLCSFGTRLQELRLRRNWTLRQLADQSGLSKAFLSRLESGDRQASIAAVLTLSRVFGVSLASLFESDLATDPCVIVRRRDAVEHKAKGLVYVPLSKSSRFFNLQPMRVKVLRTPPWQGALPSRGRGMDLRDIRGVDLVPRRKNLRIVAWGCGPL